MGPWGPKPQLWKHKPSQNIMQILDMSIEKNVMFSLKTQSPYGNVTLGALYIRKS